MNLVEGRLGLNERNGDTTDGDTGDLMIKILYIYKEYSEYEYLAEGINSCSSLDNASTLLGGWGLCRGGGTRGLNGRGV